jgi:hypothetical protein
MIIDFPSSMWYYIVANGHIVTNRLKGVTSMLHSLDCLIMMAQERYQTLLTEVATERLIRRARDAINMPAAASMRSSPRSGTGRQLQMRVPTGAPSLIAWQRRRFPLRKRCGCSNRKE